MSLNVLWHSAPAFYPTGYGVQTRYFAKKLLQLGHHISVMSTTLTPGIVWEGIEHIPAGNEQYGVDGLLEWPRRLPVDLIVTLFDVWTFPENIGKLIESNGPKWAAISPVDHDPIPPAVEARLRHAAYPIAMSPHGMREMQRVGLSSRYVPHGVDTKIYKPMPSNKKMFNAEGMFVVGNVATNIEPLDRKGFAPTFEAFGRFHKKHPKSRMYVHCVPTRSTGGLDLIGMAHHYGFELYSPDPWQYMGGIPTEKMAEIYNSFDVLLMLTRGEGFGLPIIEAQACGTPVIVTDFTAPSDLVGAGWKIPIAGKRLTPMNSYFAEPDVDKAVEALEEAHELYQSRQLRSAMTDKGLEFTKDFDFDVVFEKYLIPFLKEVEDGKETEKSDGRGGQEAIQHVSEGRVHNSQLGKGNPKRSKRRRKKSKARA